MGGYTRAALTLPAYTTPPGLAVATIGRRQVVVVVVDGVLLTLEAAMGRVATRTQLDVQALGWPAAVVAPSAGRVYLAGQPRDAYAAVIEALTLDSPNGDDRGSGPRVLWRAQLGLTHAGIWIGRANANRLAVYLPNAYDSSGTVEILDERHGAVQGAYTLPAPPLAEDATVNRIFVQVGATLRAFTLDGGRPVAGISATGPVAVDSTRGLIAFVNGGKLVLATTRALVPVGRVAVSGVTALAATLDGAAFIVGRRGGLSQLAFSACAARSHYYRSK